MNKNIKNINMEFKKIDIELGIKSKAILLDPSDPMTYPYLYEHGMKLAKDVFNDEDEATEFVVDTIDKSFKNII